MVKSVLKGGADRFLATCCSDWRESNLESLASANDYTRT
jgi:hypothetical protein